MCLCCVWVNVLPIHSVTCVVTDNKGRKSTGQTSCSWRAELWSYIERCHSCHSKASACWGVDWFDTDHVFWSFLFTWSYIYVSIGALFYISSENLKVLRYEVFFPFRHICWAHLVRAGTKCLLLGRSRLWIMLWIICMLPWCGIQSRQRKTSVYLPWQQ